MVSLDGVLQHPTDSSTTRSYTVIANILSFTAAPANGVEIQARHLGFAGAATGEVTGFYGRSGNVNLTSSDHITTGDITSRNINATGIITATKLNLNGVLTYDDVTNVDSIGIITARKDIHVGAGVSVVGIVTASSFAGDGSNLTGVTQSDTPLASSSASTIFYESDSETTISTDTTLSRASSNTGVIYTKFQQVVVAPTKSLIVDAGETFVVDAYGLRTPDI